MDLSTVERFSWRVKDETDVYSMKDLMNLKLPDIPTSASSKRSYDLAVVTKLGALDRSGQDILTRWLLETSDLTMDPQTAIAKFHSDSQGLGSLDRAYGAAMLEVRNLKQTRFGPVFAAYVELCMQHKVAPRGRVLAAILTLRFRIDRQHGRQLTQLHLYEIKLEGYKIEQVRDFMIKIGTVLTTIRVDELKDHDLMFDWLYNRVRSWHAIKSTIDKIKRSRLGSHRRT